MGDDTGGDGPGKDTDHPDVGLSEGANSLRTFSSPGPGRPQEILVEPTFGRWICAQAISVERPSWGI